MRYARLFALLFIVASLSSFGVPARAQSASASLYAGEVPVADQSDEQRAIALKSALAQVVVKLTGDRNAVNGEAVAKLIESADRYVQQYTYRQDVANVDGQPVLRLSLVASFDRGALDRVLRDRGLRVWTPAARAPVVTWIAVDDGNGPRLIDGADPAGRAMQLVAEQRGATLVWPRIESPDQAQTTAQIVWEGDVMTLSADAARYQTDTVLIGQLRRVGDAWSARWTLALGGQAQPVWESRDADLATALSAGADGAVDRTRGRSAAITEERRITTARVWVSGLQSAQDYARLFETLGGNDLVREFQPEQARGDGLLVKLTLNLALDRWLAYLPPEGVLRVVNTAPPIDGVEATLALNP
ncbi:MAG TPA: DUF2066 domain-containing protein [Tahibacter sp.]|uniref:DUF2066 domain-containing protein n=1 Tax=Tahibacter sp. TaxID=2056211 RepID=UPI002B8B3B36|nr:DUF2066 domain-containing protein [Tahibacter sp.]HSX60461.1 DUF2066 domain-containing protein [Tahibacter sp.]